MLLFTAKWNLLYYSTTTYYYRWKKYFVICNTGCSLLPASSSFTERQLDPVCDQWIFTDTHSFHWWMTHQIQSTILSLHYTDYYTDCLHSTASKGYPTSSMYAKNSDLLSKQSLHYFKWIIFLFVSLPQILQLIYSLLFLLVTSFLNSLSGFIQTWTWQFVNCTIAWIWAFS